MIKKIGLTIGMSVLLTLSAGAQEAPVNAIRDIRQNVTENVKTLREGVKVDIQAKRDTLKKDIEMRREEAKKQVEAKKLEFKEKAKQIRDEKKKQLAERLDENMRKLNERMTNHFVQVVDKIEAVLGRVKSRMDKAVARGLNVDTVKAAVIDAEKAITAAREAIKVQAAKVYAVALTDADENLKTDFAKVRQQLHADLKVVRDSVKAAHDAVRKVAVALAQISKVDEEPAPAPAPVNP